jgi:chromosome segregation ATPase
VSTMTKVFVVLTAVLSIALSCLFIAAAAQTANWKQLAQDYQDRQTAEFMHRMNLQAIMEATLSMRDQQLQAKARDLAAAQDLATRQADELKQLQASLAREMNDRVAAQAGQAKLQEILGMQNAEVAALQKQNQMLLAQNIDFQTRNTRLNSRVLELTSNNTILTDQVRNLQEKLYAAEQQAVRTAQGGRPAERATGVVAVSPSLPSPIMGQVVSVDGNYASINVGQASGVTQGMTFMVHRGSNFLADIVVDRVWPDQAGGKLKSIQQEIRPGDSVSYGLDNIGS